jgi:DNA-binding SARP family transcriptional activator
VFALCGLARTLAEDDPAGGRQCAAAAVSRASRLLRARALCAAGWVELWAAEFHAAGSFAAEAELEGRRTGDRPSIADALLLGALSCRPPDRRRLEAAVELWDEVGNVIERQRSRLMLALVLGDDAGVHRCTQALSQLGVAVEPGPADLLQATSTRSAQLEIATLGRFAVLVDGERIAAGAWQSRKARDLLKLLVGRQGRPVTREGAAEALWPGEAPGPLANRLSVALSTLRKVLDPERSRPPDHFIAADAQTLELRLDHVSVDVVEFLALAREGMSIAADGDLARAESQLREAERLYTGDFLEEDLYEDWAVDCRETARSAALEVSRLLARAAGGRGDDETASRHLRRLLERDPYDEDAWIALIGAQSRLRRYGEAHRQHAIYSRRMAELEVAPVALATTLNVRP